MKEDHVVFSTRKVSAPASVLRVATVTLALAGLVLTSACSGRGDAGAGSGDTSDKQGVEVKSFAIVTPEKETDHGWNQQGLRSAQAAAERLGIELSEHTNVGYDNTETILTQIADSGVDLVIAHASGFNTAGARVGVQTGVPTLVVDIDQNVPGKIATAIPQPEQGAYLAGVVAAKQTATRTVGVVASAENLNWFLMAGGFAQGVFSVDPTIEVVIAYVGPANYSDSAGAASTAKQVIAKGADVIMGMGNGATIGYLQAIETAQTGYPISYIATIGDVSDIVTDPEIVLTSVLWDFTGTYVQAIADIENGTFGTKSYDLTVENEGITLMPTPRFTNELKVSADQARQGIINGSIKVERATEAAQVQALVEARES